MREMDTNGLKLCAFQGRVFELSRERTEESSPIFIRRFMNSKAADRLDHGNFLFDAENEYSVLGEIAEEYGKSTYGKTKYDGETLYWMGYLYRYWSYTREKPSTWVYRMMPGAELGKLYLPYHGLDPDQAISRICEAKGIRDRVDYFERGKELFTERLMVREKNGFLEGWL